MSVWTPRTLHPCTPDLTPRPIARRTFIASFQYKGIRRNFAIILRNAPVRGIDSWRSRKSVALRLGNLHDRVPESSTRLFQDPVFRSRFRIQRIDNRSGETILIILNFTSPQSEGLGHGSSFHRDIYILLAQRSPETSPLTNSVQCFYTNKGNPSDSRLRCKWSSSFAVQYCLLWPSSRSTGAGERRALRSSVYQVRARNITCGHAA